MIFTFHNTTEWWRYLASRLEFATATLLVSDLPDADIDISPAFHEYMQEKGIEREGLAALGDDACDDVIARCRLLRVLDRHVAMRMIGAMWRTIEDLLDHEKPELFVCFIIDRYILDLFDRALKRRGVRYVGLAIGVLPETFMFMARGEHTSIREPSDTEVESATAMLTQPEFVPSYVTAKRFDLARFLGLYLHLTTRALVFALLRIVRNRPYDYVYLAARWPACGFRVRLRDWRVMRYFRADWRDELVRVPFERRVFLALSVNPEAAIEYWVRDPRMIDYETVLEQLAVTFGRSGFRLFVKDHPSQFGYRRIELIEKLARTGDVSFVPYDVPARWLIEQCRTTITWTGTVGLQSAVEGRCAVVAEGVYYFVRGLLLAMRSDELDELPRLVADFAPDVDLPEVRRVLVRHLLRASAPGVYMSWKDFTRNDPERVQRAATLVESLNRYIPALAAKREN
jgi:capsular polysaccharide biosynthesis protein